MQSLRCKTAIENPGKGTSAAAMQEEVQAKVMWCARTIAEKIASHSCFMILKHDRTISSNDRERKNSRSNYLRHETNLQNVRENRQHVDAMSLVRSTQIYISA